MAFNPTYATVENEDCNLHYYYQGTGPLITFIPGGNGHSRQFNNIITLLSPSYTCMTFDRRQMSSSKAKTNKTFSHIQKARDVKVLISTMGYKTSIIFGSSLGGIIGFQFAIDFPEMVEHLICHEAPTLMLLPDATAVYEFLRKCWELSKTYIPAAQKEFDTKFIGFGEPGVPATSGQGAENEVNFWENEFLVVSMYTPDLRKLVLNGTSVGVMAGERSRDAWYARTTIEQEKIINNHPQTPKLGCLRMVVPGHHQGFEVETEAFAPYFVEMIETLEKRREEYVH